MTPQDYRITSFRASDRKDDHGNVWCNMSLEGFGEPVALLTKDPGKWSVGDSIHGKIEEKTSKAGKPYYKFQRVMKEENAGNYTHGSTAGNTPKKEWTPRDDEGIKAQFAIKTAVALFGHKSKEKAEAGIDSKKFIEEWAKEFYAMVDRVKDSGTVNVDNIPATPKTATMSEAELASLAESKMDEPIDLSDIPFSDDPSKSKNYLQEGQVGGVSYADWRIESDQDE